MGNAPAGNIVLTDYATTLIRVKARQLCRRTDFSSSEHDDITQELWLRLLTKAHYFDPQRGSLGTFVDRVVCSHVRTILRGRRRQSRLPWSGAISLERTIVEVDGIPTPAYQTISEADLHRRIGTVFTCGAARQEEAAALAHALRSMPARLRDVCQHLREGTISSAARALGTSRRQVRSAKRAVRRYFQRAGLEND